METKIYFLQQHEIQSQPKVNVIEIPFEIDSKQKLLDFLSEKLNFPSYFGHNWDALADLFLRYLSEKELFVIIDNSNLDAETRLVFKGICYDWLSNEKCAKIIYIEKVSIYQSSIN